MPLRQRQQERDAPGKRDEEERPASRPQRALLEEAEPCLELVKRAAMSSEKVLYTRLIGFEFNS